MGDFIIRNDVLYNYNGESDVMRIPDGVVRIDVTISSSSCAENIKEIYLPASLRRIDTRAFGGFSSLTCFHVDPGNEKMCEVNGIIYSKNMSELILCPEGYEGEVVIPDGVEIIKPYAFGTCEKLTYIEFPETVLEIQQGALSGCSGISNLVLPKSLKVLGQDSLFNMHAITKLIIPQNLSRFGEGWGDVINSKNLDVLEVDAKNKNYSTVDGILFSKKGDKLRFCPNGKKGVVNLPEGVEEINAQAFADCAMVTEIKLPSTLKKIGSLAFLGCESLTTITIPSNINTIGKNIFENCKKLSTVNLNDGLEKIDDEAFLGCISLDKVVIPKTVKKISQSAFREGITIIALPDLFKKMCKTTKNRTAIEYLVDDTYFYEELRTDIEAYILKAKKEILEQIIDEDIASALTRYSSLVALSKKNVDDAIKAATEKNSVEVLAALQSI